MSVLKHDICHVYGMIVLLHCRLTAQQGIGIYFFCNQAIYTYMIAEQMEAWRFAVNCLAPGCQVLNKAQNLRLSRHSAGGEEGDWGNASEGAQAIACARLPFFFKKQIMENKKKSVRAHAKLEPLQRSKKQAHVQRTHTPQ